MESHNRYVPRSIHVRTAQKLFVSAERADERARGSEHENEIGVWGPRREREDIRVYVE